MHTHTHIYTLTHTHAHTHIHTCTHTHTHMHAHTHTHTHFKKVKKAPVNYGKISRSHIYVSLRFPNERREIGRLKKYLKK